MKKFLILLVPLISTIFLAIGQSYHDHDGDGYYIGYDPGIILDKGWHRNGDKIKVLRKNGFGKFVNTPIIYQSIKPGDCADDNTNQKENYLIFRYKNLWVDEDQDDYPRLSAIKQECIGVNLPEKVEFGKSEYPPSSNELNGHRLLDKNNNVILEIEDNYHDGKGWPKKWPDWDIVRYKEVVWDSLSEDCNCDDKRNFWVGEFKLKRWFRTKDTNGEDDKALNLELAPKDERNRKDKLKWGCVDANDNYTRPPNIVEKFEANTDFDGWTKEEDVLGWSDCDTTDGTIWKNEICWVDKDGDGHPASFNTLVLCSGDTAPSGYMFITPDAKPSKDCDDNDPLIWEEKPAYMDKDGDGYALNQDSVMVCSGDIAGEGYVFGEDALGFSDCDDNNASIWSIISGGYDKDGDGWIVGDLGSICVGNEPFPDTVITVDNIMGDDDCDDNNNLIWRNIGVGADKDGDGWIKGTGESMCIGDIIPNGYIGIDTKKGDNDCNDEDASIWRLIRVGKDGDGDGWIAESASDMCIGENPPSGYIKDFSGENDCDDTNPSIWGLVNVYTDQDGDGWVSGSADSICLDPNGLPPGKIMQKDKKGDDCDDANSSVYESLELGIDKDLDGCKSGTEIVCIGESLPPGYVYLNANDDTNDSDPNICEGSGDSGDSDGDGHKDENDCAPYDGTKHRNACLRIIGTYKNVEMCIGDSIPTGYIKCSEAGNTSIELFDFNVYPNPASNIINILPKIDRSSRVEISLVDPFGRLVRNLRTPSVRKGQIFTINTSDLKPGLYQLTIRRGDMVESKTIAVKL